MPADFEVPIVIVGSRTFGGYLECLTAVGQRDCPKFEVFICENGGAAAFDAPEKALSEKIGPCEAGVESVEPASSDFVRARRLRLAAEGFRSPSVRPAKFRFRRRNQCVDAALACQPGWTAPWILNPDTYPEPDALAELAAYASERGKGMVGSR